MIMFVEENNRLEMKPKISKGKIKKHSRCWMMWNDRLKTLSEKTKSYKLSSQMLNNYQLFLMNLRILKERPWDFNKTPLENKNNLKEIWTMKIKEEKRPKEIMIS